MGLDMYLEKKTYVKNWDHMKEKDLTKITVKRNGKPREDIDTKAITYITEEIGYWRKANAVHNFFVEKCGDGEDKCQQMYVDNDVLVELLDICKKIIKNPKLAKKLLPTKEGFFFGSYHYDEWYLNGIKATKKICIKAIKAIKNGAEIYYQASW